jgi:hypothetical protein
MQSQINLLLDLISIYLPIEENLRDFYKTEKLFHLLKF